MQSQRVKLTYQDYLELPDDGRRYEIIEGDLVVTPSPGRSHQGTLGNINDLIRRHVRAHDLGELYFAPFDVILDEFTIVQPDLIVIGRERLGMLTDRGLEGPPSLVVEIVSPSSSRIDRVRKLHVYARFGVPSYWIVDPASRSIEAYTLTGEAFTLAGALSGVDRGALPPYPDLEINLIDIWS